MTDLFPELTGLKGGKKQAWVINHLELIWSITDEVGFERAKEILRMKDATLVSALQRAEKSSPAAVTNGKRALAKSKYVEGLAYDIEKRLNSLQGRYERSQQAIVATLDLLERVLLMLRLALTGDNGAGTSRPDFETRAGGICVTSSKLVRPLHLRKSPTVSGLLEQAGGKGTSLSTRTLGDHIDYKKYRHTKG